MRSNAISYHLLEFIMVNCPGQNFAKLLRIFDDLCRVEGLYHSGQ